MIRHRPPDEKWDPLHRHAYAAMAKSVTDRSIGKLVTAGLQTVPWWLRDE
jgi:hypothetical protein